MTSVSVTVERIDQSRPKTTSAMRSASFGTAVTANTAGPISASPPTITRRRPNRSETQPPSGAPITPTSCGTPKKTAASAGESPRASTRYSARNERSGGAVVRPGDDAEHDEEREELPVRARRGERHARRAHEEEPANDDHAGAHAVGEHAPRRVGESRGDGERGHREAALGIAERECIAD